MTLLIEERTVGRSTFYRAFARDNGHCVYCDLDTLKSFDSFAASHLDHLKPSSAGGAEDDPWNRVVSCGVCNSLKAAFDPCPGRTVTAENFAECVKAAREFVESKRGGTRDNSYWRDYHYWLNELKRSSA